MRVVNLVERKTGFHDGHSGCSRPHVRVIAALFLFTPMLFIATACGDREEAAEAPAETEAKSAAPGGEGGAGPVEILVETLAENLPNEAIISDVMRTPAESWPMFRGNAHLTGVTEVDLPANLEVLWSYEAGGAIDSSAAIVGDAVYVGSFNGQLHAIDFDTGEQFWTFTAQDEAPISSSPAVAKGCVFFGDEYGRFYGLDAATGDQLWSIQTEGEVLGSPQVVGEWVLFGSYDEQLWCVNEETGEIIWTFEADGPVHCTPGLADGKVFISGCDGVVRAIDLQSGEQVGAIDIGSYIGASPAYDDGTVYAGNYDNTIHAFDVQEYSVIWEVDPEPRDFPFYSSAAVANDRIVLGGRDKFVRCLAREDGRQLWQFPTGGRVDSSPAISEDRVYVGSSDGNLYVLDLHTGSELSRFTAGGAITASPAIARDRLILGSQDGILYCFGGSEGI